MMIIIIIIEGKPNPIECHAIEHWYFVIVIIMRLNHLQPNSKWLALGKVHNGICVLLGASNIYIIHEHVIYDYLLRYEHAHYNDM